MADIYAGPGVTYGAGSGSYASPMHIQEALEQLNSTDKRVIMKNGTYTPTIFNNNESLWTFPTSEGNRQTLQAESKGGVIWKPTGTITFKTKLKYFTFKDINFDFSSLNGGIGNTNGFQIFDQSNSDHIHYSIWDNCELKYAPAHNIYFGAGANNCSFLNCVSFDAGRLAASLFNNFYIQGWQHTVRGCMAYYTPSWRTEGNGYNGGNIRVLTNTSEVNGVSGSRPQSDNNLIEDNYSERGTIGIVVGFSGNVVRNNVCVNNRYGTSNMAIEILMAAGTRAVDGQPMTNDNFQVYNNTCYNSATAGSGVRYVTFTGATATNSKVKNNIFLGFTSPTIYLEATVDEATNLTADPGFTSTNPASFDFHIAEDGAADGTGTDLSATGFSDDKDGLTRPQNGSTWCIGAYEVPSPAENNPVVNRSETVMLAVSATSTPVPTITITDVDGNLVKSLLTVQQGTLAASDAGGATIQTGT